MEAGILFGALTLIPITLGVRAYGLLGLVPWFDPDEPSELIVLTHTLGFYLPCVFLAGPMALIFDDASFRAWSGWTMLSIPALLAVSVAAQVEFVKKRPRISLALVAAGVAGLATAEAITSPAYLVMSVWFFGCFLAVRWMRTVVREPRRLRTWRWEGLIVTSLAIVGFFAQSIYGIVKPEYGGGAPVPVLLHLKADVPNLFAPDPAQLWLIEETDRGWYVVRSRSSKSAVFLPRELVSAVEFGRVPDASRVAVPQRKR